MVFEAKRRPVACVVGQRAIDARSCSAMQAISQEAQRKIDEGIEVRDWRVSKQRETSRSSQDAKKAVGRFFLSQALAEMARWVSVVRLFRATLGRREPSPATRK